MNVELIWSTPDPIKIIGTAYGICTGKEAIDGRAITHWIDRGHETPLEHAVACVRINVLSRVALAQLTRHRLASYSVVSHRYTKVPEYAKAYPESMRDFSNSWKSVWDAAYKKYEELIECGVPQEDARYILPQMAAVDLIMTANFREWRHIIDLRAEKHAQGEIRKLSAIILKMLSSIALPVFDDLAQERLDEDSYKWCRESYTMKLFSPGMWIDGDPVIIP